MRLHGTAIIHLPVDQVFALWSDLERSPEYSAATLERRKLTDGPVGVGTRYHAVDRWPGRTISFTVEITGFDPDRRMTARWSDPMPGGWDARFEAVDGGTRLAFRSTIEPSGVMGLLAPLMRPWAARQLARFMGDFRRWAEAQPGSSVDLAGVGAGSVRSVPHGQAGT